MKIVSVKNGFEADHSSSSYEFVALEKRLTKEEQEEIRKMGIDTNSYQATANSSRKCEYLLMNYYDIMYRIEYDYYKVSIALNVNEEEKLALQRYEFDSEDERGSEVWIEVKTFRNQQERVIISFYAELYAEKLYGASFASKLRNQDFFLKFLAKIQEDLKNHCYDALYAFLEKYGSEDDLKCVEPLKNKNSETYRLMKLILNE